MHLSFETEHEKAVFGTKKARRRRLAFWKDLPVGAIQLHHRDPKSFEGVKLRAAGRDICFGAEVRTIDNQIPVTTGRHGVAHYICAQVLRKTGLNDLAYDHRNTARGLMGQITDPADAVEAFVLGVVGGYMARKLYEMPKGRGNG